MTKIHIDTDLGGDIDDLCALAMVLAWPDVELVGVTTVAEHGGKRAGYVRYVLDLAGRSDVPVATGAEATHPAYRIWQALPDEDASPQFQLATIVCEYAEVLRESYWAQGNTVAGVLEEAERVGTLFGDNPEVTEFVALVREASAIAAN